MALVTKDNVKKGQTVYACCDERPYYSSCYNEAIITDIFEDHYLYKDLGINIENVWGFYDTDVDNSTVAVFTTEKEAKDWISR